MRMMVMKMERGSRGGSGEGRMCWRRGLRIRGINNGRIKGRMMWGGKGIGERIMRRIGKIMRIFRGLRVMMGFGMVVGVFCWFGNNNVFLGG